MCYHSEANPDSRDARNGTIGRIINHVQIAIQKFPLSLYTLVIDGWVLTACPPCCGESVDTMAARYLAYADGKPNR